MRFAFIEENEHAFQVTALCKTFGVSRSGYYTWKERPVSETTQKNETLLSEIEVIHDQFNQIYGSPRMHDELLDRGHSCCVNTVAKLMQQNELRAKTKKKFIATTNSNHGRPVAENLLNRRFDLPQQPNEVWVSDITYLWTDQGWVYLAAVVDLFTRKVVGWSLHNSMTTDLVEEALLNAIRLERPACGLMIHSDRGSQYASARYQQLLKDHGMICSMSRKGNCWDNAPMESFFATLKKELTHHERYRNRQEVRRSLFEYIETFYNRIRKHSALGYKSPIQFEQTL
ncbi:MAG: IS3 family transposase [Planctomycetaceae bacterium]|nr:IS3 family transposase [Planctomycetaceae bacterium]